ncbi:MAG: hypothetical protein LAN62_07835 [Acidobacteriia bacterium]|nr:hypothetical protein [Terriglobia bacterium]
MLARQNRVYFKSSFVLETPLLLPSFSSKGFPEVRELVKLMSGIITSGILVSAYDLHYGHIPKTKLTFSEVIFLDSGGYEARVDYDLSDAYRRPHKSKQWTRDLYLGEVKKWKSRVPTVVVSFDSPTQYTDLEKQIRRARELERMRPDLPIELLIKPERKEDRIPIDGLIEHVQDLRFFVAVGFTEKELDKSTLGRMVKIARLRRAMDAAGVSVPIHIFGSLDTVSTPLYFISGAEIFDGLTWLRFGYHAGATVYFQNYGITHDTNYLLLKDVDRAHRMWVNNYYYLEKLRDEMVNFARTGDFGHFKHIGDRLQEAYRQVEARAGM